jgi:hypothetical protein
MAESLVAEQAALQPTTAERLRADHPDRVDHDSLNTPH